MIVTISALLQSENLIISWLVETFGWELILFQKTSNLLFLIINWDSKVAHG